MRKTILTSALTGLFATMAHAQSSVTLYGLIDVGITYANNVNGRSLWQETSGAINNGRWGLRGAEDLGGGLKAIFMLENGFNVNNGTLGQQGREFGRQAFVGLSSERFGTLTLGRQYDDIVKHVQDLTPQGTQDGGNFFAHPFDNDQLANTFRVNNSVHYESRDLAGFKFGAGYGFSNAPGAFSANRAYSFGTSYNFGGFSFGAGYVQLNNGLNTLSPAAATLAAGANAGGAVTDSIFAGRRERIWGVGANYKVGQATAGFVFTQTRVFDTLPGTVISGSNATLPAGGSLRFNNYDAHIRYQLTPTLKLVAQYVYVDGQFNNASPKWQQVGLLVDYFLSKRTDIYLMGNYQHVNAGGVAGLTAELYPLKPSSNANQVAATAGFRTRF